MPRITETTRGERRRQFVDAALECLEAKSYRDVTVDDICAEAGLSKGAFYTHFDSKQALFTALLEEDALSLEALITDVGDRTDSGMTGIRHFLQALLERGDDEARVQLRADLLSEMLNDVEIRERFVATVRERRTMLAGWVSDAVDSGEMVPVPANALAAIVLALSDGLMLHHSLDPEGFRWSNIRRALYVLLEGLEPESDAADALGV